MRRLRLLLPALAGLLAACSGGERAAAPQAVRLEIEHRLGGEALQLGHAARLVDGSELSLSRLAYYLGGLRFEDEKGQWHESARAAEPSGDYVLVDAATPATLAFEGPALPPGRYRNLELRLGIDAARNAGGALGGALDPAHGMYWTWKTGYIFFSAEGHSSVSADRQGGITWHIGGDASVARTVVLPLPAFEVRAGAQPVLRLRAYLDQLFGAVDLRQQHTVMDAEGSQNIADAYAAMFRLHDPAAAGSPLAAR